MRHESTSEGISRYRLSADNPRTKEEVGRLIVELHRPNGSERERARKGLERMGEISVPYLAELLFDQNQYVRWEACKALGTIKSPSAAPTLVRALDDENMEIRWLAAEALIALKTRAIAPLLSELEIHFDSIFLRQGAHHVLHAFELQHLLNTETLAVLDALRYLQPQISVAVAAMNALESLRKPGRTSHN